MSKQKKPLTLISSSTFSHSKSTLALPLQAYPLCCADTIDMQLSRLHKYQNRWWWHMLFPFWCKTALGDCLATYPSNALPGCLSVFCFVFFFWRGPRILTEVTEGEYVCVYWQVRLEDWPAVQLSGAPGAANINACSSKKPNETLVITEQMDTCIQVTRIKLTKCLRDSGCEHFKCQVDYTACTPLKAISAGCRATFLAPRNPYSAKCPYAKQKTTTED